MERHEICNRARRGENKGEEPNKTTAGRISVIGSAPRDLEAPMKLAFLLSIGSIALIPLAAAQESKTILDAPLVVVPATECISHLLDWNGDGLQDFAVLDGKVGSTGLNAYLNDGRGGLVRAGGGVPSRANLLLPSHMETFDANGDGRDDLVWVMPGEYTAPYYFQGSMRVLSMPGNRLEPVEHLEYYTTIDLGTVLDADHDGDVDRVRIDFGTLRLELFERDATGAWTNTESTLALGFRPQALLKLDYDGDGYTDLYLHNGTKGFFISLAGGTLHPPVSISHGVSSPMPMAIPGDIDGDGDEDLTFFDMQSYKVYRRTAPASWELEPRRIGGPAAKFADVDGDGDLDGVCCGSGDGPPDQQFIFSRPSTFRVALNDGTGVFAPAFTFPGLGSLEIAGAADLDRDGDVDLAAGQCIYFARGPLTHPPGRRLARAQSARSLADFDRDGDADFTAGIGTFERNLGDGSALACTLRRPPPPAGTTDEGPGLPGDWDGDGDVDLIVRRWQGTSFLEMRLLLNEGGGTYADGGTASSVDFLPKIVGVNPESSFAVDLDLDGDLDLATTWRDSLHWNHWTRTWVNDGGGHFTLVWQRNGWALGFAALHGSPAPDALLAPSNQSSSSVHLYPGLGDGTFAGSGFSTNGSVLDLLLSMSNGPASLAFEDFDRDGDLDLVGAFQFGGASFAEGKAWFIPSVNGSLSLDAKVLLDDLDNEVVSHPEVPNARIAVAGDVDGDGLKDVILSAPRYRRPAVSIVRRNPTNTGWLPPVHQVVYPADPRALGEYAGLAVAATPGACLDIDGDGDAEYVTDVIWNNCLHDSREWGARRQRTGGRADGAGRLPTLGASGPFRPGDRPVLRLSGVPSGALAVLSVARSDAGGKTRALPERFDPLFSFLTEGPAAAGAGGWRGAFTVPSSLAGLEFHLRVDLLDALDPRKSLRSNVLELTFGL